MRIYTLFIISILIQKSYAQTDQNIPWVIPPIYDNNSDFSEGIADVSTDDTFFHFIALDTNGKVLFELPKRMDMRPFSEGLAAVFIGEGSAQYMNTSGKIVIPRHFDSGNDFSEGWAAVTRDVERGYIDHSGNYVLMLPSDYTYHSGFHEGRAMVGRDRPKKKNRPEEWDYIPKNFGFINKKGVEIVPCRYEYAADFREGLARVQRKGKWGFVDRAGKEVLRCRYADADDFSEGLAAVSLQELKGSDYPISPYIYGFIDSTGKLVIPCQFANARPFTEGLSAAQHRTGKWGFVDKTGTWVIQADFDWVDSFSEGLAVVRRGDRYGAIDHQGTVVIPFVFQNMRSFHNGRAAATLDYEKGRGYVGKSGW